MKLKKGAFFLLRGKQATLTVANRTKKSIIRGMHRNGTANGFLRVFRSHASAVSYGSDSGSCRCACCVFVVESCEVVMGEKRIYINCKL